MQQTCRELEQRIKELELTSVCVYCGTRLVSESIDTKMKDVIGHMAECKKHPIFILLNNLETIEKWFIQHSEHSIEIWNGYASLHKKGMFSLTPEKRVE